MAQEISITLTDDLHVTEDGQKVAADETHEITLDGIAVIIDLTAEHSRELEAAFARYLDAGRRPEPDGTAPVTAAEVKGWTDTPRAAKQRYNKGLTAYAKAHGFMLNTMSATSSRWYYPADLRRAFARLSADEQARWIEKGVAARRAELRAARAI